MNVLALDFDGVLCNSSREVLVVAVDAYARLRPESRVLPALRRLRADVLGGSDVRDEALCRRFEDLLPLGNRAEDFGVALWILEHELTATDQDQYDAIYDEVGEDWRTVYHGVFYEARAALRNADLQAWLGLHRPYPELSSLLRRHHNATRPALVTAKDAQSVHLLLKSLQVDDLFEPQLILDKETGVHKLSHLEVLQGRTGAAFAEITFVDDKVNHLRKTSVLGIRPVLAGWGFNTPREHELAHRLGYEVATLANAEHILFKGANQ